MTQPAFGTLQLGLHDPIPGQVALRFASYVNWRVIPTPPVTFNGHINMVPKWGMLGNGAAPDNPPGLPNGVGNCAIVGPCHQIMKATAEGGAMAPFNTPTALLNYGAVTGWNINDPDSDQGTNIDAMAGHWRKHGLVDAAGTEHKITAYLDLNPGDMRELHTAMWLFPLGVGCGYELPESALEQAQEGRPWDVVPGSPIAGGHYVPGMAYPGDGLNTGITWGLPQLYTDRWHQTYNNQGIVVLSKEGFTKAATLEGFDYLTLADDLKEVTRL
jgi:hypothetical protein